MSATGDSGCYQEPQHHPVTLIKVCMNVCMKLHMKVWIKLCMKVWMEVYTKVCTRVHMEVYMKFA